MAEPFWRIWHGKSEELCQQIPAGKVDCIITDPPFGSDNQSNMAVTDAGKKYARKIANDESPEKAWQTFVDVMSVLLPKCSDKASAYVFTSYQVLDVWLPNTKQLMAAHGFAYKAIMTWVKDGPGMGDLTYPYGNGGEFILGFRRGSGHELRVPRKNGTLYYSQIRPDKLLHPHEKPQALLRDLVKASTDPGDFIVDPFGGSGSLVRAAKTEGVSALAIEYDKDNFEIAVEALQREEGALL